MAEATRAGRISPAELVDAHLRQIELVNPSVNAFVRIFAEEARAANPPQGPLYGVPVTIKDCFDVQGTATACGSRLRCDHRATKDAAAVARLRAAGAIVIGKTNCPEFLTNYESDNHIAGRTNNPWDLTRTSGGSSGGESAAIAAFCSAGGVGSDGGGSIRWPAHCTGIAGLKPTPGRVSGAGHYPVMAHPGGLMGVAGPMARTVGDVRALFDALEGYDIEDPFSVPVSPAVPSLASLRVGVMEQFYQVPVEAAVRHAVRKAAALLAGIGCVVDEFVPQGLERAPNLWGFLFTDVAAPFTRELIAGRENDVHWTGIELYNLVKDNTEPTAKRLVEVLGMRDAMRATFLKQLQDVPVVLLPASGVEAFRHRERKFKTEGKDINLFQAMMPLTFGNLLGLPALVLPMSLSENGMPIGVQLIAAPWREELLLELGMRLEEARGAFPLPERIG